MAAAPTLWIFHDIEVLACADRVQPPLESSAQAVLSSYGETMNFTIKTESEYAWIDGRLMVCTWTHRTETLENGMVLESDNETWNEPLAYQSINSHGQ